MRDFKMASGAMFGNFEMVESIDSLLDPDIARRDEWSAAQLAAYCHAVSITFSAFVVLDNGGHSSALCRAMHYIGEAAHDIAKLNGTTGPIYPNDAIDKLTTIVGFIKDLVAILDKRNVPLRQKLISREPNSKVGTFYDFIADMIFEVIVAASKVSMPRDACWSVQYGLVWSPLFSFNHLSGSAGKKITLKLRRIIYEEVKRIDGFNFKSARTLGYCLNVMGLRLTGNKFDRKMRPLHAVVLSWTRRHFASVYAANPQLGEACLVEGLKYDQENSQLVQTHLNALRPEPTFTYFPIDHAHLPSQANKPKAAKRKRSGKPSDRR